MKLVFAGTPAFAATALRALLAAGHEIVLVLSQPDRPSGRGLQVRPTPVKAVALEHGIPVLQPAGLRLGGRHDADARDAQARLAATPHDAMIVAAYGLILRRWVLDIPPRGCINIHASLLPRWRGAAPIQRALEAGDATTGVTIMAMDEGLDTGAMLLVRETPIAPDDTAATLTDRLAELGGEAVVEALARLAADALPARPQHPADDASAVTYAGKVAKEEGRLDFALGSRALVDRVRAFDPWPGCSAVLVDDAAAGTTFKVWRAIAVSHDAAPPVGAREPGRVLGWRRTLDVPTGGDGAVLVASGDGVVALLQLQKPGGKRLGAQAFERDFAVDRPLRFVPGG